MVDANKIHNGFNKTEVGTIPEDWKVYQIGDIANVIGGGTPNSFIQEFWNGNINWFTPTEIGLKKYVSESVRKITKAGYDNCSAKMLPIGTVLLTSRAGIGDTAILKKESCTNQGFQSLVVLDPFDNEFIYYTLNLKTDELVRKASGSTFLEISPKQLKQINIPLPPTKAEQTAIATALSDMDALIEAQSTLIAKKRMIKQGAMQELLKPRDGWKIKKVGEIGKPYGGLSGKSKSDFSEGNSFYIPFMNVMSNPIIDINYFDKVKLNPSENQNKAVKGDLFFNGSSETPEEVGMCSILLEDVPNLYLNSFCFGFRLHPGIDEDGLFLAYWFRSDYGRAKMFLLAQGATRYNLSKSNFLNLEIHIPVPNQQKDIAAILYDIDQEIEKLEIQLEKYQQLKTGMMQDLLTGKKRLI